MTWRAWASLRNSVSFRHSSRKRSFKLSTKAVLHRLARSDVVPFDAVLFGPAQHSVRRELGTVVADDHRRPAKQGNQPIQFASDAHARERGVDQQGQAFPREVVDHDEDPEATSVDQCVGDEVQRPALDARRHAQEQVGTALRIALLLDRPAHGTSPRTRPSEVLSPFPLDKRRASRAAGVSSRRDN